MEPRIAARPYGPTLIMAGVGALCAECDPEKADRRANQRYLNRTYLSPDEMKLTGTSGRS